MAWYFELPWYLYVAVFLFCLFVLWFVIVCIKRNWFANYRVNCDTANLICNTYGSTDMEVYHRPKMSAKRIAAHFDYSDSDEYGVPNNVPINDVDLPPTCANTHLNVPSTSTGTHLNRPTPCSSRRKIRSNNSSESDDGERSFTVTVQINRSDSDNDDVAFRPNDYDNIGYIDKSDDDNKSGNNRNTSEQISERANAIRSNDFRVNDTPDEFSCSKNLSKPKIVITDYSDKPSTSKPNDCSDIYEIIEIDEHGIIIGDVNKLKHVRNRDDIGESDNANRLDEITESENGATENPTPVDVIKPDSISKSKTSGKSDDVNRSESIIKSDKKENLDSSKDDVDKYTEVKTTETVSESNIGSSDDVSKNGESSTVDKSRNINETEVGRVTFDDGDRSEIES